MNRRIEAPIYWIQQSTISHRLTGLFLQYTQYEIRNTRLFMQNEPNFTNASPAGLNRRETRDENMQNEPNFITANRKSTIETRKSLQILLSKSPSFSSTLPLFFSFSGQKCAFFVMLCNFLTLTHLTQCTTKTYITFHSVAHERRATKKCKTKPISTNDIRNTKKCKTNPISTPASKRRSNAGGPIHSSTHSPIYPKMQNEPNFNPNPSCPNSPNGSRATGHESRINMQNKPNFKSHERKYSNTKDLRKYLHLESDIQISQSKQSEDRSLSRSIRNGHEP